MKKLIGIIAVFGLFTACGDTDEKAPDTVACFEYTPTEKLQVGAEITFTNCSENAINFKWDFGDGHASTEKKPKHIYENSGEYTVKMIATNETSSSTVSQAITIMKPLGLNSTPEAAVEHDTKSGGIYKGIIVGSSGTIKVYLQDKDIHAEVTFNGESKKLIPTTLNNWSSGKAISSAIFSSGNWELKFSVESNGNNPQILLSIPNHSTMIKIMKETSTELVRAYEGTYAGDASGVWNSVIKGSSISGIRKWSQDDKKVILTGTVSGDTFSGSGFKGLISGHNISGTWSQEASNGVEALTGTISGVRKL